MAQKLGSALGMEIVDVQYVRAGGQRILRILIDKPGGIGIDDCERFSGPFSDALDEVDPIPEQYYLEVSSPGPDRPLKREEDFDRFRGMAVEIQLTQAIEGRRSICGTLGGMRNASVVVQEGDREWLVPFGMIRRAKLDSREPGGRGGTFRK